MLIVNIKQNKSHYILVVRSKILDNLSLLLSLN